MKYDLAIITGMFVLMFACFCAGFVSGRAEQATSNKMRSLFRVPVSGTSPESPSGRTP